MNAYDERLLDVLLEEALGVARSDEIAERVATRVAAGEATRAADAESRARQFRRAAAIVVALLALGAAAVFFARRSRDDGAPPPRVVTAENARLDALVVALSLDESRLDPRDEVAYKSAVMAAERAVVDAGELRVRDSRLFAELRPRLLALLSQRREAVVRRAVWALVDDENDTTRAALATAFARVPAAFDANLVLALAENGLAFAVRHMREFVVENPENIQSLSFSAALAFDGDPIGRAALEAFLAPGRRESLITYQRQLVAAALERLGDPVVWRREIRALDAEVRNLLTAGDLENLDGARRVVAYAESIADLRKAPVVRLRDLRRRLVASEHAAAGVDDPPARLLDRVLALLR